MNIELLLQVKEKILQEPENFGMLDWFGVNSLGEQCGTAACIAGHTCLLGGILLGVIYPKVPSEFSAFAPHIYAKRLLQIKSPHADALFVSALWPAQFRDAYSATTDLRIAAKVAAKRIDHFIATEGRE